MKRHLVLTGPDCAALHALLCDTLGPALGYAGGYSMHRTFDENGALRACTLFPAAAAADPEGWDGEMYLVVSGSTYFKNNEVFRETAVRQLQEAAYYPLVLLDCLGGFELLIPQFRAALGECLQLDLPMLILLKSPEETQAERELLGLSERFSDLAAQLRQALEEDGETALVRLTPGDEAQPAALLRRWARENLPFLADKFPE